MCGNGSNVTRAISSPPMSRWGSFIGGGSGSSVTGSGQDICPVGLTWFRAWQSTVVSDGRE
eukprot:13447420-Alexandrium_andersonii.AAC.1